LKPVVFEENGNYVILSDYRDTIPLLSRFMVVRPWFKEYGIGGVFIGERRGTIVNLKFLEPVPELVPVPGRELKTGANASVKLYRGMSISSSSIVSSIHMACTTRMLLASMMLVN